MERLAPLFFVSPGQINYQIPPGTANGPLSLTVTSGAGIKFRSSLSAMSCTIGGAGSEVIFAGAAPEFVGLDQVNARLQRSLAGRGEVDVVLFVDGKAANTLRVSIR